MQREDGGIKEKRCLFMLTNIYLREGKYEAKAYYVNRSNDFNCGSIVCRLCTG
jgi:hypothetical protein